MKNLCFLLTLIAGHNLVFVRADFIMACCKSDRDCSPCWCWTCFIFWVLMICGVIVGFFILKGKLTSTGEIPEDGNGEMEEVETKAAIKVMEPVARATAEVARRMLRARMAA